MAHDTARPDRHRRASTGGQHPGDLSNPYLRSASVAFPAPRRGDALGVRT